MAKPPKTPDPQRPAPEIVLTGLWGWLPRTLGIHPWGQVLITVLVLLIGPACYFVITVETRLSAIDQHITDLPSQVSSQVDAKFANFRADLIKELLQEGRSSAVAGDITTSLAAIRSSTTVLVWARKEKLPISTDIFEVATQTFNNISAILKSRPSALIDPIYRARVALADYRTSITKLPMTSVNGHSVTPVESNEAAHAFGYSALMVITNPNHQFIGNLNNTNISNFVFVGGHQTLDNAHWHHVLFAHTRIVYHGGPLELSDVTFVNCTFDAAPDSPNSAILLEAAALDKRTAVIG